MCIYYRATKRFTCHMVRRQIAILLAPVAIWLLSGCTPKVQIPAVDQFQVVSGQQEGIVDMDAHADLLLEHLYQLFKANEGVEVPLCTAERDSRQCVKEGVRFFVMGGVIPGLGSRSCYVFGDIILEGHQLAFTKDNRKTKFIGTPMYCRANKGRVSAKNGGLQVEMTTYYSNWAAIGNSTMAEGWAIDYLDFTHGVVGLQLELDVKGIMVAGGGSRYVLLKFPNIPQASARLDNRLKPLFGNQPE